MDRVTSWIIAALVPTLPALHAVGSVTVTPKNESTAAAWFGVPQASLPHQPRSLVGGTTPLSRI
jgi:hypothetical protein